MNTSYTLQWNPRPHLVGRYVSLLIVLTAISTMLSWLAVITIPGGFIGVGALYFASIFYALATYWFGGWGVIASFVGALIGSGLLSGMPLVAAIPFAVADIWEPLLPFILLRTVGPYLVEMHPLATNAYTAPGRIAFFVVFCAIMPPVLSGLWGTWILVMVEFVPPELFWVSVLSWSLGASVLLALFVPPICYGLGGYLENRGLACTGIWS